MSLMSFKYILRCIFPQVTGLVKTVCSMFGDSALCEPSIVVFQQKTVTVQASVHDLIHSCMCTGQDTKLHVGKSMITQIIVMSKRHIASQHRRANCT